MEQSPNNIMVTQNTVNRFDIRIMRDIEAPEHFVEELAAIDSAQAGDEIHLHLCTDGGSLHTALLIRKALMRTPAHTRAHIGPNCCSAGTVLALSCDEWEIDEFSTFMIHAATFGIFGKHNEVKGQYEFKEKWLPKVFDSVYTGFMSEEEIQQILAGKDFWFTADELNERLTYYAEYRKALHEAEAVDAAAEQD